MEALAPEEGGGAAAALAGAVRALEAMRGIDAELDALADRAVALSIEAEDLAGELRRYGEGVDAPPGRLDEVEERLAGFERLKRKHGGSARGRAGARAACRARRDELAGAEEALDEGVARLEAARAALAVQARALREAREAAGTGLAAAVRERPARPGHGGRGVLRGALGRARATGPPAATRWSS